LNRPPFCPKCNRHLKTIDQPKCRECLEKRIRFDFAWAACQYIDPVRDLICRFKYGQRTYLRRAFAKWILQFIQLYNLDIGQFDIIVPIPLHLSRYRERGYNQSLLLAGPVAGHFGIDLDAHALIRTRPTSPQATLSEKERWTNIRGAFRIRNPSRYYGKNILIVDDLLTTGATASEAAHAFKRIGTGTVGVLTLAITV